MSEREENTVGPDQRKNRIPRNVRALGILSLLTDASSEMVYPILPLFLTNVLGAPVAAVGLIESVAEATASLTKVVSGWLSDRAGRRKPLVVLGYSLSNLVKPLLVFANGWPMVLALRFADRLGKGIRTAPRDALIADSSTEAHRGRDFGVHRALDTVGAAIGPLVAWAILTLAPDGYRTIFLVSAIPGTLAIVFAVFVVRDIRHVPSAMPGADGTPQPSTPHPPLRLRHLGRPFAVFTAVSSLFALGNSSDAMLVLRAQNVGMAPALIPLAYFVFNVVGSLASTPIGIRSDRVGRRRVLVAGFAGYAIVYAGFALMNAPVAAWVLFALYGIPYAMTEGITRAYVVDLVDPAVRATAIGGYTFVLGIAALPASLVAGLLWDAVGPAAPFWLSAVLMAAASVALAVTGRGRAGDSSHEIAVI